MKKNLVLFLLCFLGHFPLLAQTELSLKINHYLGEEPFSFDLTSTNNLDQSFILNRLEYYISGIEVIHDNGNSTTIDDRYLLVNANEPLDVDLGTYNISSVEAIKFYVGVDEEANHSDPASYPSDHPLAPKNPSMHWGWASGYRFLAIEGFSGSNVDQIMQIHALGDENYYSTSIDLDIEAEEGKIKIELDADCDKILNNIDISQGFIEHGTTGAAIFSLENMVISVFTPASQNSSTVDLWLNEHLEVFPNPSSGQDIRVRVDATVDFSMVTLKLIDSQGNTVYNQNMQGNVHTLDLDNPSKGVYMLQLIQENEPIALKKLIIE